MTLSSAPKTYMEYELIWIANFDEKPILWYGKKEERNYVRISWNPSLETCVEE